jgi:hypothetical protein
MSAIPGLPEESLMSDLDKEIERKARLLEDAFQHTERLARELNALVQLRDSLSQGEREVGQVPGDAVRALQAKVLRSEWNLKP